MIPELYIPDTIRIDRVPEEKAMLKKYMIPDGTALKGREKSVLTRIKKYLGELDRLEKLYLFEKEAHVEGHAYVAGVDEAGRGPLAGPVVAAAVVLPPGMLVYGVNDSKKLTPGKREKLYEQISKVSLAWAVGIVDEKTIDEINIRNAARVAMVTAIEKLEIKPDAVLVDAEELNINGIKCRAIVKGDALSLSIAAASIIAKVTRDRMMVKYEDMYPGYGFSKHKGYGTAEHIRIIRSMGLCPIHRKSFTEHL